MNKIHQVVTHSGVFHADEVMAVAVIRQVVPGIHVSRSRDPEVIANSLMVVDVGGDYNEGSLRFDHHQREGAGERANGIPYSSCGLVWKRFGMEICLKYFGDILGQKAMFEMVDAGIISAIDLVDCKGMKALGIPEEIPLFSFSNVISGFNGMGTEDMAFANALSVAEIVLDNELRRCAKVLRAKKLLEQDISLYKGNPVLVLSEFIPGWAQSGAVKDAGFTRVVFQDLGGDWRCQVVPDTMLLPEAWGGLSGEDLIEVSGVSDAVFCHRGRFIAGAKSQYGAMALAVKSLD